MKQNGTRLENKSPWKIMNMDRKAQLERLHCKSKRSVLDQKWGRFGE